MASVLMVLEGVYFNARPACGVHVDIGGDLIAGRDHTSTGSAANAVGERLRSGAPPAA